MFRRATSAATSTPRRNRFDQWCCLAINCAVRATDCRTFRIALDHRRLGTAFPRENSHRTTMPAMTGLSQRIASAAERKNRSRQATPASYLLTRYDDAGCELGSKVRRRRSRRRIYKAAQRLGLRRPRVGFYAFRRTFRTIATKCAIPRSTDMGHTDGTVADAYQGALIDDARLQQLTEHVRLHSSRRRLRSAGAIAVPPLSEGTAVRRGAITVIPPSSRIAAYCSEPPLPQIAFAQLCARSIDQSCSVVLAPLSDYVGYRSHMTPALLPIASHGLATQELVERIAPDTE